MQSFRTNDGIAIRYIDTSSPPSTDSSRQEVLILIHGFTGSSAVWKKNIPAFAKRYRVIAPDLRGHGESDKPKHGFHVSRLAMDLRELIQHLQVPTLRAVGGSLGCSILWCYAELFTTAEFSHMIFVDQSPLQNSTLDGWDSRYCNRGMNSAPAVAALQATLALSPRKAHKGTIAACLAYRSHPRKSDEVDPKIQQEDEDFFLGEAMKGDGQWYGKLMEDHTALDWRESIKATFGPNSASKTKVFVIASSRSGCFPSDGPLQVVEYVSGGFSDRKSLARGFVTHRGGHWCYWENPEEFNSITIQFLNTL